MKISRVKNGEPVKFHNGEMVGIIGGYNTYQVVQCEGCYRKLVCTNYVQEESIGCDVNVYSNGSEVWINKQDFHLFELLS